MDAKEIQERLAAPFPADVLKFKPQAVSKDGSKALPVAYIDGRIVQDRLDEVLGSDGWETEYQMLPDGQVECRLTLHFPGRSVTRADVGGQSKQPDAGDKIKSAYSDALKRAAVNFGVGRYLYKMKLDWQDFDNQRKQFIRRPTLPGQRPQQQQRQTATAQTQAAAPAPAQAAKAITLEQKDAIDVLCRDLGWTWPKLCNSLQMKFGVDDPAKLSYEQAAKVIDGMTNAKVPNAA